MKRLFRWFDRNPLLGVWLGFIVAFLIMLFGAPLLLVH
jgi:hypothetical protein